MSVPQGSGWVHFALRHRAMDVPLFAYTEKTKRNQIIKLENGLYVWRRDPDVTRGGVRKGNQRGDFDRMLARAFFTFNPVNVTDYGDVDEDGEWKEKWDYRKAVRPLRKILDSGWNPRADDTDHQLNERKIIVKVEVMFA